MTPRTASPTRLEDVARRLASLPHDKQTAFAGWLAQREISVLSLPIVPQVRPAVGGGRKGLHTEEMGYLLAEMQHLTRSHPEATW